MARTVRDANLESRKARERLTIQKEPYWRTISQGAHIGYYKGSLSSQWYARLRIEGKEGASPYLRIQIGKPDDVQDADGVTVLSFSQAQEKARVWLQEQAQKASGYVPLEPLTVSQAAERYLAWFKDHRRGYKETYTAIHAHILPALGDRLVSELTTKEIRNWLHKLAATPARKRVAKGKKQAFRDQPQTEDQKRARKASANRTLSILKALLNRSFQDELIQDDLVWRRVKPFEKADEPTVRFLIEADCRRLLNACRSDFRELVRAALFTGARYSELTGLEAKDFNLDTKQVYIRPGKSGRGRHIPLNAEGLDFFTTVTAGRTGEQIVFQKENGAAWGRNHHVRLLLDACKNARIEPPVGFHDLRHTYASLLAQAGADLLTISKLLGHADTRITSRHYAHLCDRALAKAVETHLPSFGHIPEQKVRRIR